MKIRQAMMISPAGKAWLKKKSIPQNYVPNVEGFYWCKQCFGGDQNR